MDRLLIRLVLLALARLFPTVHTAPAEWWRRKRSNGWPIVQGRVHTGRALYIDKLWSSELAYSYSVNGEYYSGHQKQYFATERQTDEYLQQFPRDAAIFVRHKPNHPEVSLIRHDDQMGLVAYARR